MGIAATILSGGNVLAGLQGYSLGSSFASSILSGNPLRYFGAAVGSVAFGAMGKSMGLGLAARMGKEAAYSFSGGFIQGAVEFGTAGFGAGFGGALGAGQGFRSALKAGGQQAAIAGAIGGVIQGSYMAGWQDVLHGNSRVKVYEAQIKRLHDISVKNLNTTAIMGSRPVRAGLRHRYIRGRVGRFEMGPDEATGLIEINGENSVPTTNFYLNELPSQVLETTVAVSQAGFNKAVGYYNAAWVNRGIKYSPAIYNSNYAPNTVIYGAGADIPQNLGSTYQGADPFN